MGTSSPMGQFIWPPFGLKGLQLDPREWGKGVQKSLGERKPPGNKRGRKDPGNSNPKYARNSLTPDYWQIKGKDRLEVTWANPPFGGKEKRGKFTQNFPYQTKCHKKCFLQQSINHLKKE